MNADKDDRDPLDKLVDVADRLEGRVRYEQENRRGLLWVHGLMGLFAGPQMLLWGSATTIEQALGIWTRVAMSGLGTIGGFALIIGLSRRPRSIPLEALGLSLIALWDGAIAAGLAFARIKQDDYRFIPLDQPLVPGYVSAYPITIYVGLLALVAVHLYTLRRLVRSGLKGKK